MRLIDADEFIKTLQMTSADVCADFGDGFAEFGYSISLIRLLLSEAPAVEVVTCRDCKYYDGKWLCKISGVPSRKPCDFCSYGERKDGVD